MTLVEHAKNELARINPEKEEMQSLIEEYILKIIEEFSSQGHSGFSASYTIQVLHRLLNYKPLTALTGEPDEWEEYMDGMFQNKRFSQVFKHGKDGVPYWSQAKVFSDNGVSWYTSSESHVDITFPFHVPDKPEFILRKAEENV